jgi:hypothetical protein
MRHTRICNIQIRLGSDAICAKPQYVPTLLTHRGDRTHLQHNDIHQLCAIAPLPLFSYSPLLRSRVKMLITSPELGAGKSGLQALTSAKPR